MSATDRVLILDFGSQFTQLIARRVREAGVFCEIRPFHTGAREAREGGTGALILSGGPASIYAVNGPRPDPAIFELGLPVLGICYGMHAMAHDLGGTVREGRVAEYGPSTVTPAGNGGGLFAGIDAPFRAWMSHGDSVEALPPGFAVAASSPDCPIAAASDERRRFYMLQFHPEVAHTENGATILRNFLFRLAGLRPGWNMGNFLERAIAEVRAEVGDGRVISALSGGVDSSVVSVLVHRAVGDRLTSIFVDHGLLRKGESDAVMQSLGERLGLRVHRVDARERFLTRLRGVEDPEEKRRIIGAEFIRVFEESAEKVGGADFLAQGTLYPDVIESVSTFGPSARIKTHHNVGGLPEVMRLRLVEPVRFLFKDEVRELGRRLGIPEEILGRHPFPGPGLAVRILGEVTEPALETLREADAIFLAELRNAGLYDRIWQAFAVLLPVRSVGVMGDGRTYANVLALRAVTSVDGMTADWADLPRELLARISSRIVNEVRGVNRVVYDVSSKPPATIEWE